MFVFLRNKLKLSPEEILSRATNFRSQSIAAAFRRQRWCRSCWRSRDRSGKQDRPLKMSFETASGERDEGGGWGVGLYSPSLSILESLWPASTTFWNGGLIHRPRHIIYSRTDTSKFSLLEIEWFRSKGWVFFFSWLLLMRELMTRSFEEEGFIFSRPAGTIGSKVNRFLFRAKLILVTSNIVMYGASGAINYY